MLIIVFFQELSQKVDEVESENRYLTEELKVLKMSMKKVTEQSNKLQEENSSVTFKLAQLTAAYDKLEKELVSYYLPVYLNLFSYI